MNILIIINDAPYGTEAAYNALRLARALQHEDEDVTVNLFLMGDGVSNAVAGQSTADGYYNVERMLTMALRKGATMHLCQTCMKARGVEEEDVIEGAEVGSMSGLAQWTLDADKVINY
ncbi:MAG: DsrE family protein [Salinivenus sp.]